VSGSSDGKPSGGVSRTSMDDERQRFNTAVMAGSVAPRSAGSMFRTGWREASLKRRVVAVSLIALATAVGVFAAWAGSSGRGRVALYALLALVGCALLTTLGGQCVLLIRAWRRRPAKHGSR